MRKGVAVGNTSVFRIVLLVIVALYTVSPVDCAPGPIDDLIVMLMYVCCNRASVRLRDRAEQGA